MGAGRSETSRRVTVAEAARVLGVTVEAVRGRIKWGTLAHEREGSHVFVLLPADQARPVADQQTDRPTDQALIVTRLENEVQFLREELARKDAILLNMSEAMKAISPPAPEEPTQEPSEAPQTGREQPGRVGDQASLEGVRTGRAGGTFKVIDAHSDRPGAREPPESPESVADEQQGRGPIPDAGGAQEPSERPWWRRMFGG